MRALRPATFLIGTSLLFATACGDDDDGDRVEVALAGENEVPPVATTASGRSTATLDGDTLEVQGDFSGLESDLVEVAGTPAHVHEGAIDEAGPVLFNLDVDSEDRRSGTFSGTFSLTDEEIRLFEEGLLYVNVHTEENPGGELRGQLVEDAPEPAAVDATFDADLSADNEVADVDSDAEGRGTAVLRRSELTVSGSFEGLTTPLMAVDGSPAHIHEAPAGEDGPIVFPLDVAPEEDLRSGRFSLTQPLTDEQLDALRRGDYYINVHSEQFPGGEIRGQLLERP